MGLKNQEKGATQVISLILLDNGGRLTFNSLAGVAPMDMKVGKARHAILAYVIASDHREPVCVRTRTGRRGNLVVLPDKHMPHRQ
jgi:hypothetical protein